MDYLLNHRLKFIFILLFTLLVSIPTQAQVAGNYSSVATYFTSTSGTLADMTGSTQLIGANQVNASSAVTSFGSDFAVWFMGQRFTNFSVNTNGVLQFGTTVISNQANTYAINTGEDRISPLSSGTQVNSETDPITGSFTTSATGEVHYKAFGTSPNRYIVVEWKNMVLNHRSTTPLATFQAHIYETTPRVLPATTTGGRIFFVYGEMPTNFLDDSNTGTSVDVQLGLGTGTFTTNDYLGFNLTSGIPLSFDNDGKANSASYVNNVGYGNDVPFLHTTTPGSRRVINFEVTETTGLPNNFQALCITDTKIDLTWVAPGSTNAVGYVLFRSTTSSSTGFSFLGQVPLGTTLYTDAGLTPGTTYYYRLYMVNEGKLSSLAATASVTATTGATAIYSTTSGRWNDGSTWEGGIVPTATDDVVINCNDVVSIANDATCNNLQINNSSTLQFYNGGHTLAIAGNFTNFGIFDMYGSNANVTLVGNLTHNGGTWMAGTSSTFTLSGSTAQTITNLNSGTSTYTTSVNTPYALSVFAGLSGVSTLGNDVGSSCTVPVAGFAIGAGNGFLSNFTVAGSVITEINITINHTNNEDLEIFYRGTTDAYKLSADNGLNGTNYTNVTFSDYATQSVDDFAGVTRSFANETLRPATCTRLSSIPIASSSFIVASDDAVGNDGTVVSGSITTENRVSSNDIAFYNLVINNSAGITLGTSTNIRVVGNLTLTDGIINGGANEVIFTDNATTSNGSNASYIDGVARKVGDDAFTFPVGDNNHIANIAISAPGITTDEFTAQYFHVNPDNVPYDRTSKDDINLTKISACEYWILNRAAGTSDVNVSLSYQNTRSCGVGDPAQLKIAHWNGTQWNEEPRQAGTIAVGALSGITTTNVVTSFSPFTLATQDPIGTPLPTQLLSFDIFKDKNGILTKWQMMDESNIAHYQIQRSEDGISFQNIGNPTKPNKEQSDVKQYITLDKDIPHNQAKNLYYRLQIVNENGSYYLSKIKQLKLAQEGYKINYTAPNPFQNRIELSLSVPSSQEASIEIQNLMGQIVLRKKQQLEAGNNLLIIEELNHLPKGPYVLNIAHASGKLVRTILKK